MSENGDGTTLIGVASIDGKDPSRRWLVCGVSKGLASCFASVASIIRLFFFCFISSSLSCDTSTSDRVRSVFSICSISRRHFFFSSSSLCIFPLLRSRSVSSTCSSRTFLSSSSCVMRSRVSSSFCDLFSVSRRSFTPRALICSTSSASYARFFSSSSLYVACSRSCASFACFCSASPFARSV